MQRRGSAVGFRYRGMCALVACLLGVLAGAPRALAGTSDSRLLGFGENLWGQLGNGEYAQSSPTPAAIDLPGLQGTPTTAAISWEHSIVLTSGGQVYTIGSGGAALGGGSPFDQFWTAQAIALPGATGAPVQAAAGVGTSFVITATGQLYAFGGGAFGQLGNGSEEEIVTPELISLPGIEGQPVQVAAGREFTLVLTSGGQLYTFGSDEEGQLGDGGGYFRATPEAIALPGATGPPVQIAAGAYHSLVLTETGQLYAFGDNQYGQLGNDQQRAEHTPQLVTLPGATGLPAQIAAGWEHSLVLTKTGQLYAFGDDQAGQLGNGESDSSVHAVPQEITLPGQAGSITEIAAGREDSLVVTSTGQLYAFGSDEYGQLGNGVAESGPHPTPTLAPVGSVAAVAPGSTANYSLVMLSVPLAVETASLPAGTQGEPYSATAHATGGTPPLSWSAEGLPEGLSIDSETGQISGTPKGAADASVTLTVTDADGVEAHSGRLHLVIAAASSGEPPGTKTGSEGNPPAGTQTNSSPPSNASPQSNGNPAPSGAGGSGQVGGGDTGVSATLGSTGGTLQAVRLGDGRLTLRLSCRGAKGRVCRGRVTLTTRELTRAHNGAAFTANAVAVPGGAGTRLGRARVLQLASSSYELNAGTTLSVTLRLNAVAKRLLARKHTLPAQLVVSGTIVATRNVTLKAPS